MPKDVIIPEEGELKFGTPQWPHKITRGINEAKKISNVVARGLSEKANEIEKLRSLKNIFMSLPASGNGNDIRKNFIISVEGKLKYDTPKWPYEITPGINEAREINDAAAGDPDSIVSKLSDKFIYSILIIGSAEDLTSPLFNKQYALAKKSNAE